MAKNLMIFTQTFCDYYNMSRTTLDISQMLEDLPGANINNLQRETTLSAAWNKLINTFKDQSRDELISQEFFK